MITGFGAWCTSPDPVAAEAVAAAGFDWVLVDTQHGTVAPDALPGVLAAVELGGATPLVRVGANDARLIGWALDVGARGVVVPVVSDAGEAARAARACRHPPEGDRSFGPARHGGHPSRTAPVLCIPMIETAAGLEHADAIAATAGVDAVFVGAVDLGLDLGLGVRIGLPPPPLADALDAVVAAGRRHGVPVGGMAIDGETTADLLARGFSFLTVAADRAVLAAGMARALAEARERSTP